MSERLIQEKILPYLRKNLPAKRLGHVMGVGYMAQKIARAHRLDPQRAKLAAMLHDTARCWSARRLAAYVRRHRVPVPDLEHTVRHHPVLLHAYVGARIARMDFGVKDREVLAAIAHHSLGAVGMTRFEQCIYVADLAAPDRKFKEIAALRKTARKNLHRAFVQAVRLKLNHLIWTGEFIHPQSIRVWNRYVKRP